MSEPEEVFWALQQKVAGLLSEVSDLNLLVAVMAARSDGLVVIPAAELAGIRGRILRIAADTSGDVIVEIAGPAGGTENHDSQLR